MNQTVFPDTLDGHPLAGIEGWPATGPVYGPGDDDQLPVASSLWERIIARIRKSPGGDGCDAVQARVWY